MHCVLCIVYCGNVPANNLLLMGAYLGDHPLRRDVDVLILRTTPFHLKAIVSAPEVSLQNQYRQCEHWDTSSGEPA